MKTVPLTSTVPTQPGVHVFKPENKKACLVIVCYISGAGGVEYHKNPYLCSHDYMDTANGGYTPLKYMKGLWSPPLPLEHSFTTYNPHRRK